MEFGLEVVELDLEDEEEELKVVVVDHVEVDSVVEAVLVLAEVEKAVVEEEADVDMRMEDEDVPTLVLMFEVVDEVAPEVMIVDEICELAVLEDSECVDEILLVVVTVLEPDCLLLVLDMVDVDELTNMAVDDDDTRDFDEVVELELEGTTNR